MRLVFKSLLWLLPLYLVGFGALAWWINSVINKNASALMGRTARLVGGEIASAITDGLVDELLASPADSKDALKIIRDISRESEMLLAITVVDASGQPLASDEIGEWTERLPRAEDLFGGDLRSRLTNRSPAGLRSPNFLLEIPLLRAGEVVGYLRLTLNSADIAELFRQQRRQLIQAACVLLLVTCGLGLALHLQLQNADRSLAEALDGVLEGKKISGGRREKQEFARALASAGRLGRALSQARSSVAAGRQQLSQLSQLLDVGVVLLDSEREIDFAGQRALELFSVDEDGLARRWREVEPQLRDALVSPEHEGMRVEAHFVVDDSSRTLQCSIHLLEEEECVGFLVLLRDSKIMSSLEADLRLASRFRIITQLYLGAAHDLKAPLNAMGLNLELLRQSIDGGETEEIAPEQQKTLLAIVQQELQRLDRSLETLLAQTAPATSGVERFDVGELIEEIRVLVTPQARQQQVEIAISVGDGPTCIQADRDQIKQALLSIVINALEAMVNGGQLSIGSVAGNEGHVSLLISDTGPGIPEPFHKKVFSMHFTTKPSGTGIGLYVARSIIEAHEGQVSLAQTGPGGTTFKIQLPARIA